MNRLNRDTITAIVLLLVCGAFFWQTFYIREIPFSTMGSDVWPRFALTLMFILVMIYLVQSVATPPAEGERRSLGAWLKGYSSAITCFGMFFLFLLALPYLGMLVSGALFVFLTQGIIGRRDPRSLLLHAIISIVAVGGMWAIFRYGLGVAMPVGELFR